MAKNKRYDKEDGVWRTIGGRRVFIKTGQSLSSAMRDSGKFKRMKEEKEYYRKTDEELRKLQEQADKDYDRDFTEARRLGSDKLESEAKEKRKKRLQELGDARLEVKRDWEERLAGKEYINDYPEAYRHYEKDWESTQDFNDDVFLREEFKVGKASYPDEKDYMPGGKKWNPEWASARESKVSQEGLSKLKDEGNDKKYNPFVTSDDRVSVVKSKNIADGTGYIGYDTKNNAYHNAYKSKDSKDINTSGPYRTLEEAERDLDNTYSTKENREKYNVSDLIDKNIKRDKENFEKGISYEDYSLNKAIEKKTGGKYKTYEELMKSAEKEPYNSKAYAKELSQVYMAEEEYDDKITPKYIQDIDSARYGNMSDEDAIKEWLDGGADIIYVDDAEKKLKEWGIAVKNDDPYATYRDELAKQLLPIYKEDKRVLGLKQRFKKTYEDLKDNTNMSEAEILEFLKKLQNK